mgnify:CR=1 FL=1
MKVLKYLAITFAVLIAVVFSTCSIMSKDLPTGIESPRTEEMVSDMWEGLNKAAWDTTTYVRWSFAGVHHYLWDKKDNLAQISWKKNRVLLDPDQVDGLAFVDGVEQEGKKKQKLIQDAWSFWCNDMYWFTAPFKVKDSGTTLSMVEHEDHDRLKVSYTSGGVTPGDSYVWIFDEDGIPTGCEMYVQILPIKMVYTPWKNWTTISTGAKLCGEHKMMGIGLTLGNIAGGMMLEDVGLETDVWAAIR